jgi:hypothetical protein
LPWEAWLSSGLVSSHMLETLGTIAAAIGIFILAIIGIIVFIVGVPVILVMLYLIVCFFVGFFRGLFRSKKAPTNTILIKERKNQV